MIPTLYGLEYLGSLPYRGILSRKPSGGRALGFLPLTAGSTTPTICFFRWPRTDSGKIDERGMLRDAGVVHPSDVCTKEKC
jgi:hypothetical protein